MLTKLFLPEVPEWWAYRAALAGNEDKSYGNILIGHILWQQYRLRKKSVGLEAARGQAPPGGIWAKLHSQRA